VKKNLETAWVGLGEIKKRGSNGDGWFWGWGKGKMGNAKCMRLVKSKNGARRSPARQVAPGRWG
jgi:hypothetical protein